MPIRHIAALMLLVGPLAAQTACPTAEDLALGIRVTLDDGVVEVYRQTAPGIVAMQGRQGQTVLYDLLLAQGTHVLSYQVPGDPSSLQTYDYGMAPDLMPAPSAGGRWRADVTVTATDGTRTERQVQAYDAATTRAIGGCTYQVIPAVIAYDTADAYMEFIEYLPELGIGYLTGSQSEAGASDPISPVAIAVGK